MPRAKGGFKTRRRHKKLLKLAKGYWGQRKNVYRRAKETVERALVYAYRDRRQKKRDFRRLWQIRINAAVRPYGLNYSKFMGGLKKAGVDLNRKVLAYLAVTEPETFAKLVEVAKAQWQ
ncbi:MULTISPECIES: 50S ribosomal protein L20 [Thermodesulfobacterium]|jgi:large subunit ribosomal protein L20|uniref:Large ribosomal subunit protein bL20 n=2 Tax=Thermodesulfobacterium commune TaxID=1741 RepID=A0A075X014_9BACT|nr:MULTISPECIES: 50S ribosomal protein L20 [Thermodesulfobacterium]KUJ97866.1 MAG: 50S ribosomal protein L20 [Thermodesulfobacterium sp. 37_54]KUK19614.1 MAG: 50S ribosomal protein L20 [Thermodesulfobacterium commune]AIH04317.1 50S ribosomal protein L20 [Thermodesulfobacterium commune DSM 2178]KUK38165.1 MAG: 50S ribosomal protein L20 [Thermodesulfobacterium commune]MBZ4681531.1 rplT [Thermodesulfobacterium sp.]